MVNKGRSWLLLAAGLSVLLLGPCSSKAARDASPGSQGVDKPSKIACAKLTRTQCMASHECMLVHTPQPPRRDLYDCRVAEPTCEAGFAQQDFLGKTATAQRSACSKKPGCQFEAGGCYCHCRDSGQAAVPDGPEAPVCDCACSGGPPPLCALVSAPK
jgi:hypothetical protein